MEKLRIGLFIDTFFPMVDGVVMVVDNYARRLSEIADVTVFCPHTGESNDENLPYRVVRSRHFKVPHFDYSVPMPKMGRAFMKEIKKADLDLIHVHSPFMIGKTAVKFGNKHHIPVVATAHSQYKMDFLQATHSRPLSKMLTKEVIAKTFNACDEVWAVNQAILELTRDEYGCTVPMDVRQNGTDMKPLDDPASCRELDEKYHIADDEAVFLFVGRINEIKNIFFLVRALGILARRGMKYRMLFVGSGQDEHKLFSHIEAEGIADRVTLCGKITDRTELAKHYARADLFLFPSLYDASSLVQIEAASQGTPSVFLNGARTACTVTDGVNGFLADATEEAFASQIETILADPANLSRVAENAKRDLYVSWDDAVAEAYSGYLRLIGKISKNSPPSGG